MRNKIIWVVLFILSIAFMVWISGPAWIITVPTLFMIGVHEMGHLYAAKKFGLKTGGFYFIPGLGGAALLKEMPKERWKDFWIFYAGPVAGLLQVIALMILNIWLKQPLLDILAGIWAFINLLNLFPMLPLDGGKIFWSILSPDDVSVSGSYFQKLPYYFFTGISVVALSSFAGLFFIVLVTMLGLLERKSLIYQELKSEKIPMTKKQRLYAIILFSALVLVLALLTYYNIRSYLPLITSKSQ